MSLYELYEEACRVRTDIREHLPTLREYALKVDRVTEFGAGASTIAFLIARPPVFRTYDIGHRKIRRAEEYFKRASRNISASAHHADTLHTVIPQTDLLFIDSHHTYFQLKEELALHAERVEKYLIFHDTVTYGKAGEDGSRPGLSQAISEFLDLDRKWSVLEEFKNNNGLLVLEK
jgi:predicted O-methyltransferase YrrM